MTNLMSEGCFDDARSEVLVATYTRYNAATGLVDYTGVANAAGTDATSVRTSSTYDRWGRALTYVNDQGETTTTTYDAAGRVASVANPTGTTTYTWDGTDAAGRTERRGVTTGLTVTRAGTGGALTYKGAYDEAGTLVTEELPGGITRVVTTNALKDDTGLTYKGQVTPTTATTDPVTGEVTWTPGTPAPGTWFAWTTERDGLWPDRAGVHRRGRRRRCRGGCRVRRHQSWSAGGGGYLPPAGR